MARRFSGANPAELGLRQRDKQRIDILLQVVPLLGAETDTMQLVCAITQTSPI